MYPDFQADKSRAGRRLLADCAIAGRHSGRDHRILPPADQALASLVVVDGDRRIYIDYPADFSGPGADLWRADDGGEIHAEGFDVVFLLKRGSTYLLALDWAGAEGNAFRCTRAEGAGQFKELFSDSWYRAPM